MNDVPQHITVLLHEAVDALPFKSDGIVVDCTFGRGGHSRLIAQRLAQAAQPTANGVSGASQALPSGSLPRDTGRARLIALDKDPDAVQAANALGDAIEGVRFECVHASFAALDRV